VKRAERAELRREEILDASERIFAQKGFHAAGIADIAKELGIGHGTFYRYFKNKRDIALQVIDRLLGRLAEVGLAESPEESNSLEEHREQVRRMLDRGLALGESHPQVLRLLHEQSVAIDVRRMVFMVDAFVAHTMRFLRNGIDKGFLRADLDVRPTAEMLVALILEGTRRTLELPDADARRRWVEAGIALMFEGIRAH